MIIFLECASIQDNVNFFNEADKGRLRPDEQALVKEMSSIRSELKAYTHMDSLINKVQNGQNLIIKKVLWDKYMKSQVDLMKLFVRNNQPCGFSYLSVYGTGQIDTSPMTIKEQWALEMLMTRYSTSAMYHLAAFNQIQALLTSTKETYDPKCKNLAAFSNNVQMALTYFRQAYLPIYRFSKVYQWVERLMTGGSTNVVDCRREVFQINKILIEANVSYLMLQKLRILNEHAKCRDGAKYIHDKLLDCQSLLNKMGDRVRSTIRDYVNCGIIFFKAYCLVNFLKENEKKKVEEDLGYVKKEFKVMILENLEVAKQILFLEEQLTKLSIDSDFYGFAMEIMKSFSDYAKLCNYVFSLKNDHSWKLYEGIQRPTLDQIWVAIPSYNLINDMNLND